MNHGRILLGSLSVVALCLTNQNCRRPQASEVKKEKQTQAHESPRPATPAREVYAAWYDVPVTSVARRRAGAEELTAAHNHLPLGSRVRITHLGNGKAVVVLITDRGITDRRVEIDLCKEAARELDMISEGIARVRMEVLPNE